MINIKVLKRLLKMMLGQALFGINSSYKKLSVINVPGTISINDPHQELNPLLRDILLFLERLKQLGRLNNTIIVLIQFLESLEQEFLLFTG